MTQQFSNNLETMPKFRKGEIVTVNGVNFKIDQVGVNYLGLICIQPDVDKWQAFGQGIVEQLNENGLLNHRE